MKAEDTAMDDLMLIGHIVAWTKEGGKDVADLAMSIRDAQAEITWDKAIREVVEKIDNTGLIEHTDSPLHETGATILDCPACCWYAYKKEWGIDEADKNKAHKC